MLAPQVWMAGASPGLSLQGAAAITELTKVIQSGSVNYGPIQVEVMQGTSFYSR